MKKITWLSLNAIAVIYAFLPFNVSAQLPAYQSATQTPQVTPDQQSIERNTMTERQAHAETISYNYLHKYFVNHLGNQGVASPDSYNFRFKGSEPFNITPSPKDL